MIITRGYGPKAGLIITRGYGRYRTMVVVAEIIRLFSTIIRSLNFSSRIGT